MIGSLLPVHPRSRGEHWGCSELKLLNLGSSPLARGTPLTISVLLAPDRFIPARAGNTRPRRGRRGPPPVHPRSRGEHAVAASCRRSCFGSSPLARGTLPPAGAGATWYRFIPARAGNTCTAPTGWPPPSVHPRSRGEHATWYHPDMDGAGSSPLARGTLVFCQPFDLNLRFIPARAGNTYRSPRNHAPRTVHPRSRGEHVAIGAGADVGIGSSPLARGTRPPRSPGSPPSRFIPARAGNT